MSNWYFYEKEMKSRMDQAEAAGARKRLMAELKVIEAERRRERRMRLLAFVGALLRPLRRAKRQGDPATGNAANPTRPRTG